MPGDQIRDIYQVMHTQRAIRRFKPGPVSEEVIRRIIDAATKAPSGSNRQPCGFVVVRDGGKREAIATVLRESVLSRGTFGNLDAIEDPARRRMMKGAMELFGNFEVAASGGHNLMMQGPPGSGKTLLARALPGLIAPLTPLESIDVSKISWDGKT